MARDLYCYGCSTTTHQFEHDGDDQPECPECGSDFVEFRAAAAPAIDPGAPAMPNGLDGMANNPMELMTRILSSLAQQSGAHVVLQGPGHMPPVNLGTVGDFGFGNIEDIMTQIMANHQPVNHPTSTDLINNLPKRKVPATADHKGDEEYAVGENCCAGENCSICHVEFEAEQEVSQLPPCKHCFHNDCIKPWLEMQNTCPICRAELPTRDSGPTQPAAAAGAGPGAAGQGPNILGPEAANQALFPDFNVTSLGQILSGLNAGGPPAGTTADQNAARTGRAGQQAAPAAVPGQQVLQTQDIDLARIEGMVNQLLPSFEDFLADEMTSQDSQDEDSHSDSTSTHVLHGSETTQTDTDPGDSRIRSVPAADSSTANLEHTPAAALSGEERQHAATSEQPSATGRQNTRNPGDPYQIGFAGPSRAGSTGVARSSNTNQQSEGSGRQGLGVLQPLGWLARGAMNIGGNILGRRNSGNQ